MAIADIYWFVIVCFICTINKVVYSETFDNVKTEVGDVVFVPSDSGMDTVRPVNDSADTLDVTIDWNMVSINDFDETNGYIEVSGFVSFEWTPTAYPDNSFNITEMLHNDRMWTPPVILVNSLKSYNLIGYDTSVKVRMDFQVMSCKWQPWIITRVACSPDVEFYPFDKQSCALRFSVWGYTDTEVKLSAKSNEWAFLYFEQNGEWKIESTSSETSVIGESSTVDFKIVLKRRPLYHVINMIAPVILLGLLNAFTFLLPAASGERVSFAITCFLSYVVLLNMIMGFLPSSATPLSYLSYYTFIMMVFSAGVCVMTVVTIRIHNKSDTDHVPVFINDLYQCCTFKSCVITNFKQPSRRIRDMNLSTVSTHWNNDGLEEDVASITTDETESQTSNQQTLIKGKDEKVSWSKIASLLDFILFLAFLCGQSFFTVTYLVPIFVN